MELSRNVLSYPRRIGMMQNVLAFRDSPNIPLRRSPTEPRLALGACGAAEASCPSEPRGSMCHMSFVGKVNGMTTRMLHYLLSTELV